MSLSTPETVQKLQEALHAKAKGSPNFRFYALYDKVYRVDVLAHAFRLCKANGGAPGVDRQTFEQIELAGLEAWLGELAEARQRLRRWLRLKHKVKGRGTSRYPDDYLHRKLGLVCLQQRTRSFPWANA